MGPLVELSVLSLAVWRELKQTLSITKNQLLNGRIMAESDWNNLVERFADGRQICNCGDAYYTPCGHGSVVNAVGVRVERTDLPICRYGCSTNQLFTKYEIAKRVNDLLKTNGEIKQQ